MMHRPYIVVAAAVVTLIGSASGNALADTVKQSGTVKQEKPSSSYQGAPVLESSNYFGAAAMGYAAAKAVPDVLSHLFCYCGCDATDHHHHLIDCFTSTHGVDCHICQEEAVLALRLHKEGLSTANIQKEIDEKYAAQYPFQEPTENFKLYKASRLYKPTTGNAGEPNPNPSPTPAGASKDKPAGAPQLKPGFHAGECCKDGK